ncbi:g3837 [Coccomyxa viridis]|uniref:G3837 protein n=1 Tax=Coccomyxa viridis TaxID=1274662 RepID=A0ABP1FU38_9CHLO
MSVSLRVAKKRRVEAPAAAFADPDDDVEPTLSTEEEDEQVQKLKDEGFEKAEGKEYSSAIRLWDMALKLRPQYAALHEMKAQVFLEVKQYWPAVQSATSATVAEPSWAPGFVTLARAQYNFGEPEEALKSMDEALRLEPSNEDALAEIGEIRMQVQHRKQENHHTRVPTIEPD